MSAGVEQADTERAKFKAVEQHVDYDQFEQMVRRRPAPPPTPLPPLPVSLQLSEKLALVPPHGPPSARLACRLWRREHGSRDVSGGPGGSA